MEIGKLYRVHYQIHSLYYSYSIDPGTILMPLKQDVYRTDQAFGTTYKTQILVGHKTFEIIHYSKHYISNHSTLLE